MPLISDDGPTGVVVTGAPRHASAYALLVHTFDREQRTTVRTQGYEGSIGNLTKMLRYGKFVEIAGHRRPTEIVVDTIRGPTTTITLTWQEARDAPASLFDPTTLARPSPLAQEAKD